MRRIGNEKTNLCSAFFTGAAIADDLTIPNTFTAGTPAVAAEVNGNFTAVEASVDDNAADIATNALGIAANAASASNPATVKWLADGEPVGSYLEDFVLLTFSDYYVRFRPQTGGVQLGFTTLYFLDQNCQGQAYMDSFNPTAAQGAVFASFEGDPVRLYYRPHGSTVIENFVHFSRLSAGPTCGNTGPSGSTSPDSAVPVYPNDPAVTGVASEYFNLPMTIGHR